MQIIGYLIWQGCDSGIKKPPFGRLLLLPGRCGRLVLVGGRGGDDDPDRLDVECHDYRGIAGEQVHFVLLWTS